MSFELGVAQEGPFIKTLHRCSALCLVFIEHRLQLNIGRRYIATS